MKMLAAPTTRRIMVTPYARAGGNTSYQVRNFSDRRGQHSGTRDIPATELTRVALPSLRILHRAREGAPVASAAMRMTTLFLRTLRDDPADAEVEAKALFLEGLDGIGVAAESTAVAACWVDDEGGFGMTTGLHPYVLWLRS